MTFSEFKNRITRLRGERKELQNGRPGQRDVQQATKTIRGEMLQMRQEGSQEFGLLVKARWN